jgi:hypothetical protein
MSGAAGIPAVHGGEEVNPCPRSHHGLLQVLADADEVTVSEAARRLGCHRHVARVALEELAAIGLAACPGLDDDPDGDPELPGRWAALPGGLPAPTSGRSARFWLLRPGTKCGLHPPVGGGGGEGSGGRCGWSPHFVPGPTSHPRRSQPSRPPRRRAGLPGLWAAGPPNLRQPRPLPGLRRRPGSRPLTGTEAACSPPPRPNTTTRPRISWRPVSHPSGITGRGGPRRH